jgi:hypothetical protein
MRNLGLHLMLAALGVAGIAAQAITGTPGASASVAAIDRSAIIMPATDVMHRRASQDLPVVVADLS